MVDVGDKPTSARRAVAQGLICLQTATVEIIQSGGIDKGDVLGVARVAGIMAAKRCPDLIPLCHPITLTHCSVEFDVRPKGILARATCATNAQTGVEMEALCAVNVALLTIYDMCKAIDKTMQMEQIQLLEKTKI